LVGFKDIIVNHTDTSNQYNNLLNNLSNLEIDAFTQIKKQIDDIPPDLNKSQFIEKLKSDLEFRRSLVNRMVRLFGIRSEYVPYLPHSFIELIDKDMKPLYVIGNGSYIFREGKIEEFTNFAIKAQLLVDTMEKDIIKKYKNQ
jgi:hypothetical protein